jgi:hypothetical protein
MPPCGPLLLDRVTCALSQFWATGPVAQDVRICAGRESLTGKHIAEELLVDPLSLKYQSPGGDTFIGTRQFPSPGVSWDRIQARSAARAVCHS